jgi:hypothetical protein
VVVEDDRGAGREPIEELLEPAPGEARERRA